MIRLADITKRYVHGLNNTFILRGVTTEINERDFVSIMGPSGAGKSTLLNIIGMLDAPSEGEYFLFDQPVPIRDRRRDVPQELAAVIHHALAKKPEDRFPSAAAFRKALLPFASGG